MYVEKNLEKKWLIKSENKILGPYNFDQICDLIRKRQISLIDEIRDPETRWLYVRENPEFKNVVEEMRKEIDSKHEDTKTFQTASKITEDMLKTKTDIQHQFTDINLETKDIEVVSEELTPTAPAPEPPPIFRVETAKPKIYGVQTDANIQKQVSLFSKQLVILSAVLILGSLAAFFGYMYFQKKIILQQEEELTSQIRIYKHQGLFQKAIDVYNRIPIANQKRLFPEMLDIYPWLENAGLVSIDDVKALRDQQLSQEQKTNVELILFLQAMQQQNYGQAEDFITRARTIQPSSLLVKENEAILNLKKAEFIKSYNYFKEIFTAEPTGRYLLGMVQAFSGLSKGPERDNLRKDLLSALDKYTIISYDFKKELLLAQIGLAREVADEVLHKGSVKQFLNTPCQLSMKFVRPGLLVPNSYSWKDLAEIRNKAKETLTGDEAYLFELHNLLELGPLNPATDFVNASLPKIANPQTKDSMSLLLYDAQHKNKDAILLEKTGKLDMGSELNHLLLAQNKLELDPASDISAHIKFLSVNHMFYKNWLQLTQLTKRRAISELRPFIKENFENLTDFVPVLEAKAMLVN